MKVSRREKLMAVLLEYMQADRTVGLSDTDWVAQKDDVLGY